MAKFVTLPGLEATAKMLENNPEVIAAIEELLDSDMGQESSSTNSMSNTTPEKTQSAQGSISSQPKTKNDGSSR